MKVLIADDHEVVRVGIRNLLVETFKPELIAEACNGTELIEALKETSDFDILIMDVSMPDFSPLSRIKVIREQYPSMPILVVSAHDDDAYVQGLLGAGVKGYHLKDQPFKELAIAIERILSGDMWLSSPLIERMLSHQTGVSKIELSSRQIDIAMALANGLSNKDIAEQLTLSIKTIENHLTRLYRQLNVTSRLEAVKFIHDNPQLLGQHGLTMPKVDYNPAPVSTSGHSIVVVDDNQRFRKQLSSIIGRNFPQLSIYEAGNSQDLQLVANQVDPKIIFLDVVLGDEDGISVARKIKQKLPSVKIILITAYPDREFHRLGIEAGALALIDKKDLDTANIKQIIYDIIG